MKNSIKITHGKYDGKIYMSVNGKRTKYSGERARVFLSVWLKKYDNKEQLFTAIERNLKLSKCKVESGVIDAYITLCIALKKGSDILVGFDLEKILQCTCNGNSAKKSIKDVELTNTGGINDGIIDRARAREKAGLKKDE